MNENVQKYFLYGFLILAAFGFILAFTGFTFDSENAEKTIDNKQDVITSEEQFKLISSGSTGPGEVSIDLKPHKVVNGHLEVDISVNTHSVSLEGFDLKELTTLEFKGEFVKPT